MRIAGVVLGHPNLADVPDTAETRLDAAGWGRAKERRTPRGFGRLAEEGLHDGLRIASPKMMKKVPAPHPSPRQTSAISGEGGRQKNEKYVESIYWINGDHFRTKRHGEFLIRAFDTKLKKGRRTPLLYPTILYDVRESLQTSIFHPSDCTSMEFRNL